MTKKVVITGMGMVSPLGIGVEENWEAVCQAKSGIGPITVFDTSNFQVKVAAEIHGFEPTDYMHIKRVDRTGRCTQFAIAATRMAIEAAYLNMADEKPERVGTKIATSGMMPLVVTEGEKLNRSGPKRIDPLPTGPVAIAVRCVHIRRCAAVRR